MQPSEDNPQDNEITCYVEAKDNAQFYLAIDLSDLVKSGKKVDAYSIKLKADKTTQRRIVLRSTDASRNRWKTQIKDSRRHLKDATYQYGKLKFGTVSFSDEISDGVATITDVEQIRGMGSFTVSVFETTPTKAKKPSSSTMPFKPHETSPFASVLETKAKGFSVSHRVYYDNVETKRTKKRSTSHKDGALIASFTFRYMSMSELKARDIVPTTPEPHMANENPRTVEESDGDDEVNRMSTEELRKYVREMKKGSRNMKRELDNADGGSGSKRIKVETVDLTEGD